LHRKDLGMRLLKPFEFLLVFLLFLALAFVPLIYLSIYTSEVGGVVWLTGLFIFFMLVRRGYDDATDEY